MKYEGSAFEEEDLEFFKLSCPVGSDTVEIFVTNWTSIGNALAALAEAGHPGTITQIAKFYKEQNEHSDNS